MVIGRTGNWMKWLLAEVAIGRNGHWPNWSLDEMAIDWTGYWTKWLCHIPESATLSTGSPELYDMNPMIEKMTKPANMLVAQLMRAIMMPSLKCKKWWNGG